MLKGQFLHFFSPQLLSVTFYCIVWLFALVPKYFYDPLMPDIYHIYILWEINIPNILVLFSLLCISWLGKSWAVKNEQTKRIIKIFLVSVMGNVGLALWPALVMLGQHISSTHNVKMVHSNPRGFSSHVCRCRRTGRWLLALVIVTLCCPRFVALRIRADIGNHLLADLISWPIHEASGHGFYGLWGSTGPCGQIVLEHEPDCDPHACTSSESIQPSLPVLSGRGRMISLCWHSTAAPVFYLTSTIAESIWPLTTALTVHTLSAFHSWR